MSLSLKTIDGREDVFICHVLVSAAIVALGVMVNMPGMTIGSGKGC